MTFFSSALQSSLYRTEIERLMICCLIPSGFKPSLCVGFWELITRLIRELK